MADSIGRDHDFRGVIRTTTLGGWVWLQRDVSIRARTRQPHEALKGNLHGKGLGDWKQDANGSDRAQGSNTGPGKKEEEFKCEDGS
jgi:hypothetical protein